MPPSRNSLADASSGASSSDPLTFATSPAPEKDRVTRRTSRFAQPLAPRSPNVAASDPFMARPNTTPSKSLTMSTPGGRGASPWRIKVTVEAEQEDDDDCITVKRPSTRIETKTTTIPVKGLESSPPPKRGRGRPRKSDTAPSATQKRNGTPIRRRRKSVVKSPEESDSSYNDATPLPKSRQQSRKSTAKDTQVPEPIRAALMYGPRSTDGTPVQQPRTHHNENESPFGAPDPSAQTASSVGRRRSTRLSRQLGGAAEEAGGPAHQPQENAPMAEGHNSSESGKDAEMWRAMTSNYEYESEETAEQEDENDDVEDDEEQEEEEEDEYSDDDGFEMTMPDVTVPDITVPDVVGDTTVINSENFSMVSIDSLPSRQAALSSPLARKAIANQQQQSAKSLSRQLNLTPKVNLTPEENDQSIVNLPTAPSPRPEPNEVSVVEDSALSVSYMPSSPPVRLSARTPQDVQAHPAPPTAKATSRPSPKKPSVLKLVNVVRAGLALQGVVNGNNRGTLDRRPSDDIRERAQLRRLDKLFNDFKPKTRRELQAGLRFGQQLAERARSRATTRETTRDPSPPHKGTQTSNDVSGKSVAAPTTGSTSDPNEQRLPTPEENDHASTAQSSEQQVSYPKLNTEPQPVQLASPATSQKSDDRMSWKANTPPSTKARSHEDQEDNAHPSNYMDYEDSVLQQQPGEHFDHYWQRRRETISKKIQDANASQVIVINSDEGSSELSEQSPQDSDIWEEEASRDSSTRASCRRQRQASPQQQQSVLGGGSSTTNARRGRVARSPRDGEPGHAQISNGAGELKAGTQSEKSSNSSERAKTPETISDDADSTGLFWQKPSATAPRQPEPSQLKSDKMDLSMLLGTNDTPQKGNSFSPQRVPENLVFKAPYNAVKLASPTRGSPLKQQVVFSSPTAASSSPYSKISHSIEASELLQNSVLNSSMAQEGDSMTSDIRQLRAEAEAYRNANAKNRTPRNDQHVHQDEDIEIEDAPAMPKEPSPRRGNSHMTSLHLESNRERKPLFATAPAAPAAPKPSTPEIHPSHVQALQVLQQQQQNNSGVFSRVWSSFGSSNAATPAPTPLHPLAAPMPALPKFAPWTNTHYRALDALYQHSKTSPHLFNPTDSLNAALLSASRPTTRVSSRTGQHVVEDMPLASFRGKTVPRPGGAGTLTLTDEQLVVAGVFMQLLTLESPEDYRKWTGRELEPARGSNVMAMLRVGEQIWAWVVVSRLASVVHGEDVREEDRRARRERRGVRA